MSTLETEEQIEYASADGDDEGEEDFQDAMDEENDVEADVVESDSDADVVAEGIVEDDDGDNDDDDDGLTSVKSTNTADADVSLASGKTDTTPKPKAHKASSSGSSAKRQGRTPSVSGLTIPFRTVKKAMKLDPDIPIVQNEAAIMTTIAVELFLKRLAKESFRNAKNRGRNTVRYEDVAEARTRNPALAFLEPLLP